MTSPLLKRYEIYARYTRRERLSKVKANFQITFDKSNCFVFKNIIFKAYY